ncbi:alginate O-acetyltransferase complex protein AlgI [Lachnospiraceae bacterium KH1T2]|nr:alginate O-acetyltransferase complex protein AlgI [Lachnospiraceae bacterium KH1T2]
MVFSSLEFLFRFLPAFLLLYFIAPYRLKNLVLFIGSLIFYASGEPVYTILVLLSIVVNYTLTRLMCTYDRGSPGRKGMLVLAMFYDVGILLIFKYAIFIIKNINAFILSDIPVPDISLPLGISFYTFQIMSYVIDAYRGKYECERSILNLGTYLVMFPQLIAGPIVVYDNVSKALAKRSITAEHIENGFKTFTLGLGAKVIFANNLGNIWNATDSAGYSNISTGFAWLGILAYTLQLYFDFSGYSLMAIGLGEMMGFEFPRNFNYPYVASSVTDFWKRWHITLTSWFREYIYIPLGGNRKGTLRTYLNMFIVWTITGFWHGADWNFIFWGMYYFVILSIERLFFKKILDRSKVLSRIYTLVVVMSGWVLFAAESLTKAFEYLGRMFTWHSGNDYIEYIQTYWFILIPSIVFATPVFTKYYLTHKNRVPVLIFLIVVFWLSVSFLVDSVYNPFLYFRF